MLPWYLNSGYGCTNHRGSITTASFEYHAELVLTTKFQSSPSDRWKHTLVAPPVFLGARPDSSVPRLQQQHLMTQVILPRLAYAVWQSALPIRKWQFDQALVHYWLIAMSQS